MNVLTVLCGGGWMSGNLSEGWRRLGCTVHEFLYGTHMGRDWTAEGRRTNDKVNAELLALARRLKSENRLDLIFAVIYDDVLQAETARALRALGAPMVNYHVDLIGQWYRVLRTGAFFDRLACAQEHYWDGLRRAGIRPYLMPMAANPPGVGAAGGGAIAFEGVVYLGSPWIFRRLVLADLARAGVPLRVYGHNWRSEDRDQAAAQPQFPGKLAHDLAHYLVPRLREEGIAGLAATLRERRALRRAARTEIGKLPQETLRGTYDQGDFSRLVRGAAINLGFTHFSGLPGTAGEQRQARLRDYEIPMQGGFYLTQRCADVTRSFREGEQVACWDDSAELREKIAYYLERPEERRRVAAQGQREAAARHTWELRFRGLLSELAIPSPAPQR